MDTPDPSERRAHAALDPAVLMQEVAYTERSLESRGTRVNLEVFCPKEQRAAPTIIVLHGAGGMDHGNRYVRHVASAFAANGFCTILTHYFQSTGTSYADDQTIYANFLRWLEVVHDTVTFATDTREGDGSRIALFGYSLGAYLAIAHASSDPRVRAVVELAGGVDLDFAKSITRLPPTMIIHGENDQRVLFARAGELERLLRKLGTPAATRYYPGEGHILSPAATLDALQHGLEFLRTHLD